MPAPKSQLFSFHASDDALNFGCSQIKSRNKSCLYHNYYFNDIAISVNSNTPTSILFSSSLRSFSKMNLYDLFFRANNLFVIRKIDHRIAIPAHHFHVSEPFIRLLPLTSSRPWGVSTAQPRHLAETGPSATIKRGHAAAHAETH